MDFERDVSPVKMAYEVISRAIATPVCHPLFSFLFFCPCPSSLPLSLSQIFTLSCRSLSSTLSRYLCSHLLYTITFPLPFSLNLLPQPIPHPSLPTSIQISALHDCMMGCCSQPNPLPLITGLIAINLSRKDFNSTGSNHIDLDQVIQAFSI